MSASVERMCAGQSGLASCFSSQGRTCSSSAAVGASATQSEKVEAAQAAKQDRISREGGLEARLPSCLQVLGQR
jgi:hypothetical protein